MSAIKFRICQLSSRSVIHVNGRDCFSYVQSFMSGDLREASPAVNGVVLNAAGKILTDVLVYVLNGNPAKRQLTLRATTYKRFGIDGQENDSLLVECDNKLAQPLRDTFYYYKIRRRLSVSKASEYNIFSLYIDPKSLPFLSSNNLPEIENISSNDIIITKDPRIGPFNYRILSRLGHNSVDSIRNIISHHVPYTVDEATLSEYHLFRYKMGMAEGCDEFKPCFIHPLDINVDFMNGFSLTKGQFTGKDPPYRRKVKPSNFLRLMPIEFLLPSGETVKEMQGMNFAWNTDIVDKNGLFAGKLLKRRGQNGLAFLKLKTVIANNYTLFHPLSGYSLTAWLPFWWPRSAFISLFEKQKHLLPSPEVLSGSNLYTGDRTGSKSV